MRCEPFRQFLDRWCREYVRALGTVDLFKPSTIVTEHQQRTYVAAFQTFRGHFIETVLLPMHRLAKDPSVPFSYRRRILEGVAGPLRDELGINEEDNLPHDQLYQQFGNSIGVDADSALWDLECQPRSIRVYNQNLHGYLTSCLGRSWSDVVRGLTVYLLLERVDEFDYGTQLKFASRFSLIRQIDPVDRTRALEFFSVHASLLDQHFESMPDFLDELWVTHEHEIRQASEFLAKIHHCMYVGLSEHVLGKRHS
jgi:hypothetical protein